MTTSALACDFYAPCVNIDDIRLPLPKTMRKLLKHHKKQSIRKPPSASKKMRLVKYAHSYIGVPYLYGGITSNGIDCSAFVQQVYAQIGISLPRTSAQQYEDYRFIMVNKTQLETGDLIFFKKSKYSSVGHVAIYLGNNKIIHSSKHEGGVYISSIHDGNIWDQQYFAAKRVIK